ncbi:hypothetical protein BH18ACT13_BH18ACT13_19050 [soil metagenome]
MLIVQVKIIASVLNTSLNENKPIVMTPADAVETFAKTKMDLLVLGNHVVRRGDSAAQRSPRRQLTPETHP